ncbi:MAG TPA: ester cyclase [Ktedonobacterales bacterium]|nr:ester cyclase [Ktedonobacterales bacterium]
MSAMSAEEFKATVRRFMEELYNKGNTAVVDELVASEFVYHTSNPAITPDREGLRKEPAGIRSHFPDLRSTVEDVITEGENGAMRGTLLGTHEGAYRGIPPTHKRVEWSGGDHLAQPRRQDGRGVELPGSAGPAPAARRVPAGRHGATAQWIPGSGGIGSRAVARLGCRRSLLTRKEDMPSCLL